MHVSWHGIEDLVYIILLNCHCLTLCNKASKLEPPFRIWNKLSTHTFNSIPYYYQLLHRAAWVVREPSGLHLDLDTLNRAKEKKKRVRCVGGGKRRQNMRNEKKIRQDD